jgi:hypothetical protein
MPTVLALLGILAGAYFLINRARNAAHMVEEITDAAQTAMGAARRHGFRRQANVHPVECIEEPALAAAGLAVAVSELNNLPTEEDRTALLIGLQKAHAIGLHEAEEMAVLGQWFVRECNGPQPAITRIAQRLNKLSGFEGMTRAMDTIQHFADRKGGQLNESQLDAMAEIKRIFRVQ